MTTAIANPEMGMELAPSGLFMPVGAMEAQDSPLSYTAHERSVMAKWEAEGRVPASTEAQDIVTGAQAEDLEQHYSMEETASDLAVASEAQPEDAEEAKSGFFSGLREKTSNFVKKHPKIAKAAVAAGAVTALVAASPATEVADAAPAHTWSVLGGDPLVNGGVHSKKGVDNLLHSKKGVRVMHGEGFNNLEIEALQTAADERDIRECELKTGDHFKYMAFGQHGEVEGNVTYTSYDAPAYCIDVKVPENGKIKTINVKIPKKCANIALYNEFETPVRHPHHPKPHHPKKVAPVFVAKDAIAANGQPLKYVPSDTFEFFGSCIRNGRKVTKDMILNEGPNQDPQFLLKCDVGKKVTVKEMPTHGPDQWKSLSNNVQHQTVKRKGNLFAFKDQEVQAQTPPPPPQTPPEQPPTTPPVCTDTQPAVNCYPKDGTPGAGTGIPTQPGGPGSPGDPSPSPNTVACYDPATSTDGDMNPATEGALMWGTAADQNDYCIGQADPAN